MFKILCLPIFILGFILGVYVSRPSPDVIQTKFIKVKMKAAVDDALALNESKKRYESAERQLKAAIAAANFSNSDCVVSPAIADGMRVIYANAGDEPGLAGVVRGRRVDAVRGAAD